MKNDTPLVCNMDVFTEAERAEHEALARQIFRAIAETEMIENGMSFALPSDYDIRTLTEFIFAERRCCPFLEFTLTVPPQPQAVRFSLSGPEGTLEFLRAEFGGTLA